MSRPNAVFRKLLLAAAMTPTPWLASARSAEYEFGHVEPVGPPLSVAGRPDYGVSISSDGLTIYSCPQLVWPHDIWTATRADFDQPWSQPTVLPQPVNAPGVDDFSPEISADGLTLMFASARKGGAGGRDLWVSTRTDANSSWSTIANLSVLNSELDDDEPELSANGLELYFQRDWNDIYVSTRSSTDAAWGPPTLVSPEINFENHRSTSPVLTPDGLTLFFSSDRDGAEWEMDVYMSSRDDLTSPWESARKLDDRINTQGVEWAGDVAADGYFYFGRAAEVDAWSTYELMRVRVEGAPIPEPSTFGLLGLVAAGGLRRNSRRRLPSVR